MKKLILTILAISISIFLASCKTNTNTLPDNTKNSYISKQNNGEVTDTNGIIGDNDDLISKNKATKIGDTVNNAVNKTEDTVKNITDNIGDTVKNVTR